MEKRRRFLFVTDKNKFQFGKKKQQHFPNAIDKGAQSEEGIGCLCILSQYILNSLSGLGTTTAAAVAAKSYKKKRESVLFPSNAIKTIKKGYHFQYS